MPKNKENQKELEKAVRDFREIIENYESKGDCSKLLVGRLHTLERGLLGEFFDLSAEGEKKQGVQKKEKVVPGQTSF